MKHLFLLHILLLKFRDVINWIHRRLHTAVFPASSVYVHTAWLPRGKSLHRKAIIVCSPADKHCIAVIPIVMQSQQASVNLRQACADRRHHC